MTSALGHEMSDGEELYLLAGLQGRGATQRFPLLEGQLQFTLNVIPKHVWYAAPSGAFTFVNQRYADYLGLPIDHPVELGIEMSAEWDSPISLVHRDDREDWRRAGQLLYAWAVPLRQPFEFVMLKELTGGSLVAQNPFGQAMDSWRERRTFLRRP